MVELEFRALGPLEVRAGPTALPPLRRQQRALLAMLLLHPNRVVSTEALIDGLWGDEPPTSARKLVQIYVSQLRKLLAPAEILHTRAPGYLFAVEPDQLDVARFERLVAEGRLALDQDEPDAAAAAFGRALDLWRGPALADVASFPFATTESARLEELRLAAVEDRIEADLALGRHADLVGELDALVAEHPYRERLRGQLMLTLYRNGRQADALNAYRDARQVLVEELGVEPSPALQRLQKQLLAQDTVLDSDRVRPARAPAGPALQLEESRKTVTVLVCDLAGSSAGEAEVDPETRRQVMSQYLEEISRVLERHGGTVHSFVGDAVMAVYGHPALHEDDALRAVRAADEVLERLDELDQQPAVSRAVGIGINTGEVLAMPGVKDQAIAGAPVSLAARLQSAAGAGEILLGEATWQLVREAVRVETRPAPAGGAAGWRLLGMLPGPHGLAVRSDTPLVGREPELAQLQGALERAVRTRRAYLCTVFGDAGVGKTRLAREFAAAATSEARLAVGRCVPYGEAAAFAPFAEIVRALVGEQDLHTGLRALLRDDADADLVATRIAAAIGATDAAGDLEDIYWAARRLLAAAARERPLVIVIEDIHWAAPGLLDLVEQVTELLHDAAIVVLCLARPELLEARPGWAGGKANASSVLLEPLSSGEAERLIEYRLEGAPLEPDVRTRIRDAAEGNPLFIEQMLALTRERGTTASGLEVPETIHALLAARLDRLMPQELAVIERAAVAGKEFSAAAVGHLLPAEIRPATAGHLRSLVRKELLRPAPSSFRGEEVFRFSHGLIRDAAYRAIPKHVRADLHERLAGWLDEAAGASLAEHDELLGYHLEQSYRYRAELGPIDEHVLDVGARAAARLAAAGTRASTRGELRSAASLLERAAALLPAKALERADILLELVWTSMSFDLRRADSLLTEVAELARRTGDVRLQWRVAVDRPLVVGGWLEDWSNQARGTAEQAIAIFEQVGDERGLARAWRLFGAVMGRAGQMAAEQEANKRALEHAIRSGDERERDAVISWLSEVLRSGPAPVEELVAVCHRRIEWARARGMRAREGAALNSLAWTEAARGRIDEARELFDLELAILADLGFGEDDQPLIGNWWNRGHAELLAGNVNEVERCYRHVYDLLDRRGRGWPFVNVVADLAHALCALGRYDEALRCVENCEDELVDSDDIFLVFMVKAARAKVLAAHGELDAAVALAQDAVALAAKTDHLQAHGDRLMDLAEVLRRSDRPLEAARAIEEALALYQRKGIVPAVERARGLLGELSAADAG